ncbi:MAG: hypothetical protein AABX39_03750 [Nanoarchaeota archaeon]
MITQEKRVPKVVKKASSPVIGYKPMNQDYVSEYSKREEKEDYYSGLLWHNKEDSATNYPFTVRDNYAGVMYIKLDNDPKALKGFVGKPVHILGKNVRLEDKVNALLIKEVRPCNGKCNVFKL